MDVDVISFDFDGTLVTREYVDYFWFELVPKLYALKHGVSIECARRVVYSSYDEIGPRDIRWYLPSYWFKRFGIEEYLDKALRDVVEMVKPYDDALEVVDRLRNRYILIISTSATKDFISLIVRKIPLYNNAFRYIFSSVSDFGIPGKPPEFYRKVIEKLGVEPSRVLHIGDDEENDYRNAISIGIKAIFINRRNGDDLRKTLLNNYHL